MRNRAEVSVYMLIGWAGLSGGVIGVILTVCFGVILLIGIGVGNWLPMAVMFLLSALVTWAAFAVGLSCAARVRRLTN